LRGIGSWWRVLALVLVVLAGAGPHATRLEASEAGEEDLSPALRTERLVAEAAARNGGAGMVGSPAGLNGLPGDPLAGALAEVLVELARGREARALDAGLDALEATSPGETSAELRAALVEHLVSAGLDDRGRRWLLEGQDPVAQAGWALQLALDGRCDAAATRADHLVDQPPEPIAARLMVARALQECSAPAGALALMHATARGASRGDPRVALQLGRLSFDLGDPDSSRWWCQRALADGRSFPSVGLPARVCLAAADALRGVLPAGRRELMEAWHDMSGAPSVSARQRRDATIGGVWIAVSSGDPEAARWALDVIERADGIPGIEREDMLPVLRAMALVTLERVREARRALSRVRAGTGSAELAVVEHLAEARILLRENDEVAASTRLGEAADEARRSIRQDLTALVEMERARLAQWTGRQPAVRMHAMGALRAWREGAVSPTRQPLIDPVLPRRALEWAVAEDWTTAPRGRRAEVLLEVAAEAQRALSPSPLGVDEVVDPGRVRRLLAARNASLLYYALGESRSFAWLVEPSGVRGVELPAGGELARRAGLVDGRRQDPLTSVEGLYGGLLETVRPGSSLMIRPDGVLYSLAWRGLPAPTMWRADDPTLGQAVTLAVVPDLDTAVDPRRTPVVEAQGRRQVFAVFPGGRGASAGGFTETPAGSVQWNAIRLDRGVASSRLSTIRQGEGVLFLSLPLLSAGHDGSGVLFGLPGGGDRRVQRPLALDELISPRSRYQLICLAPDPVWPSPPGARARAAAEATRLGVRTVVLPLTDIGQSLRTGFWSRFLDRVGRGDGEAEALMAAAPRTSDGGREHLPEFLLVGQANQVVAERGGADWRFWVPLAAGVLLLAAVVLRAVWPKRDPFDVEPPEE
jgi:hypothetical protein